MLGVSRFRSGDLASAPSEWVAALDKDPGFHPARGRAHPALPAIRQHLAEAYRLSRETAQAEEVRSSQRSGVGSQPPLRGLVEPRNNV